MANIKNVEWSDIADWIDQVSDQFNSMDTILGISRGGVPIAIGFSYALKNARICFTTRNIHHHDKQAFYVFDDNRQNRLDENTIGTSIVGMPENVKNVLVVDDVATFGDTLNIVSKLLDDIPSIESINFAIYAIDKKRMMGNSNIDIEKLCFSTNIDNRKTWLKFPWQLDANTQEKN